MTSLTGPDRVPSYEQVAYREPNHRRRARNTAVVSAAQYLDDWFGGAGLRAQVWYDDEGAFETTVRTPPVARRRTGPSGPPTSSWTRCRLEQVPEFWPGTKVFRGRWEEEWPEGAPQGESRAEDIQVGRDFGRRVEQVVLDEMFGSLYGHLRDDLGRSVSALPQGAVRRLELWQAYYSAVVRHPDTPEVRLSEPDGEFRSHTDHVSALLPPGGVIVCEDSRGGLGTGMLVSHPRTWRRRIRLAVDYSWAVTAPEAFRLFTVA